MPEHRPNSDRDFLKGIGRAFGGALLFSLPILLTMEMWWLGFYAYRWRLLILSLAMVPVLVVLARLSGLRRSAAWPEDVVEGITAYGIGILASVATLALLGIVTLEMPMREIVGKIAVQSPFAAFGAVLARSQLGGGAASHEQEKLRSAWWAELFMVGAGALYLSATVAATQEMILIAFKMTAWHALALVLVEILTMHAFVYALSFRGAPQAEGRRFFSPGLWLRFTFPGYLLALLVSAYLLWTFGRFESYSPHWMAMYLAVLGLPASVGGAAGRLVI